MAASSKTTPSGFAQDFQSLLDGLKRQDATIESEVLASAPTADPVSVLAAQPSKPKASKPALGLRFHEAEDAGDAKYVKQWEQAIDNLLRSDLGQDVTLQNPLLTTEAQPRQTALATTEDDIVVIDKQARVVAERYLNEDGSTQANVQALNENIVKTYTTETGNKVTLRARVQVERIEEHRDSLDANMSNDDIGEGVISTNREIDDDKDQSSISGDDQEGSSDEEGSDSNEEDDLDKVMDQIRLLETHLDPSQAVLAQVLSSSVKKRSKETDARRRGILLSIVVFLLGLFAGMVIIALHYRFGSAASQVQSGKDIL